MSERRMASWGTAFVASLVLVVVACAGEERPAPDPGPVDPLSARIAVLAHMMDLAEAELDEAGEEFRPHCVALGADLRNDPPASTLAAVAGPDREVLPLSRCHPREFRTLDGDPATVIWVGETTPGGGRTIAGGYMIHGTWGRGFDCTVRGEGEQVDVVECRLTEHN